DAGRPRHPRAAGRAPRGRARRPRPRFGLRAPAPPRGPHRRALARHRRRGPGDADRPGRPRVGRRLRAPPEARAARLPPLLAPPKPRAAGLHRLAVPAGARAGLAGAVSADVAAGLRRAVRRRDRARPAPLTPEIHRWRILTLRSSGQVSAPRIRKKIGVFPPMPNYRVLVTYDPERNVFLARAPELEHCSAEGATRTEALVKLEEEIEAQLRNMREQGGRPPAPVDEDADLSGALNVTVSRTLHRDLAWQARNEGVEVGVLVGEMLAAGLEARR